MIKDTYILNALTQENNVLVDKEKTDSLRTSVADSLEDNKHKVTVLAGSEELLHGGAIEMEAIVSDTSSIYELQHIDKFTELTKLAIESDSSRINEKAHSISRYLYQEEEDSSISKSDSETDDISIATDTSSKQADIISTSSEKKHPKKQACKGPVHIISKLTCVNLAVYYSRLLSIVIDGYIKDSHALNKDISILEYLCRNHMSPIYDTCTHPSLLSSGYTWLVPVIFIVEKGSSLSMDQIDSVVNQATFNDKVVPSYIHDTDTTPTYNTAPTYRTVQIYIHSPTDQLFGLVNIFCKPKYSTIKENAGFFKSRTFITSIAIRNISKCREGAYYSLNQRSLSLMTTYFDHPLVPKLLYTNNAYYCRGQDTEQHIYFKKLDYCRWMIDSRISNNYVHLLKFLSDGFKDKLLASSQDHNEAIISKANTLCNVSSMQQYRCTYPTYTPIYVTDTMSSDNIRIVIRCCHHFPIDCLLHPSYIEKVIANSKLKNDDQNQEEIKETKFG